MRGLIPILFVILASCTLVRDDTSTGEDECPATWAEISADYTEATCDYVQSCSPPFYSSREVCEEANTVEAIRCFDGCLWKACVEALRVEECTIDPTWGSHSEPWACVEASRSSCL